MLNEVQRQQLDGIVQKMTANGESSNYIQSVVNDFKQKYGTPEPTMFEKFKGGAVNVAKDILGVEQNKSTAFLPSVLRSTIGSQGLAGVAQLPGRVLDTAMQDAYNTAYNKGVSDPTKRRFQQPSITPGQAVGITGNAALTVATGGTSGIAKRLPGRIVENAAYGGAFTATQNLADKRAVGEGVGTGAFVGGVLPLGLTALSRGKTAIQNQAIPAAETTINSLIKPLERDFAYGKNPARGILNEGIVANNLDGLSNQVNLKIDQIGNGIGTTGRILEEAGVSLDLRPALAPIDEAIGAAAKSNNPTLFHSLQNVKIALMNNLEAGLDDAGKPAIIQKDPKNLIAAGYNEAQQFLHDIAEHTRFTGNPSDDKALNLATKRAYGVARDIMNKAADSVDPKLGTQIRNFNERYADLLSAKSAIAHRDIVMKRQNILNLANRFSIPVTVLGGLLTGNWAAAGSILAAEIGVKAAGSTAVKTRVAQFLSKLAPEERNGIFNSTPVLKNLYTRATGNEPPDPSAPKTKALQTIEDYLKNPRLGLSIEDITRKDASGRPIPPVTQKKSTVDNKGGGVPSPTTPSRKSTATNISTGSAATGKEGVSARKADTSVPFDGGSVQAKIDAATAKQEKLTTIFNDMESGKITREEAIKLKNQLDAPKTSGDTIVEFTSKQGNPVSRAFPSKKDAEIWVRDAHKLGIKDARISSPSLPKELEPLAKEARKYKSAEEFVKAQGQPVYHGTLAKFDNFDAKKAGSNTEWDNAKFGTFFLDDATKAKEFPDLARMPGDKRPVNVKEAYITLKNPLDLTTHGIFTKENQAPLIVELLGGEKMSPKAALKYLDENIGLGEMGDLREGLYGDIKNKTLMQKAGYDGVISDYGDGIIEKVVFDTSQIKTKSQLTDFWKKANNK